MWKPKLKSHPIGGDCDSYGGSPSGNEGPASNAQTGTLDQFFVLSDESLRILDGGRIRLITRDGIIHAEALGGSENAALLRRTEQRSKAFRAGEWASLSLGAGRLAYAGIAKGASMVYAARGATMANAVADSAFRNTLIQVFRAGLWRNARIYTIDELAQRYRTAEEIIAAAGRTDTLTNVAVAGAAAGGAITLATNGDCECQ